MATTTAHDHRWRPAPLRGAGWYSCRCGDVGKVDRRTGTIIVKSRAAVKRWDAEQAELAANEDRDARQRARDERDDWLRSIEDGE